MKLKLSQLQQIIKEEVFNASKNRLRSQTKKLVEGHSHITTEELSAWKKGNLGFTSNSKGPLDDPRQKTNELLDLVDEGALDAKTVLMAALSYMSEANVADMAKQEGFLDQDY